MGLLENLHQERKARLERIKKAAETLEQSRPKPPQEEFILEDVGKFDLILSEVCAYYKVRKSDIASHRRYNNISPKRHVLIYLVHILTKMTHAQISSKLDMDPTSVGYAIKKITKRITEFQEDVDAIQDQIKRLARK